MLSAQQARSLSCHREIVSETRTFGTSPREDLALRYAQMGLPFLSEHAAYLTIHLTRPDAISLATLRELASELAAAASREDFCWVVTLAVSVPLWTRLATTAQAPVDRDLFLEEESLRKILETAHPPFACTGGDLFFHIKALEKSQTEELVRRILDKLAGAYDPNKSGYTIGDSLHGGRIYGGRMLHGLIGSVDPVCFSARAIIGDELPQHKGGCFCLTQRFIHDWQQLAGMADIDLENLIGRDHTGVMVTNDDERFHVKCVRVNDEDGVNYRLVGESQPFRSASSTPGKEDGIYQVSYAKTLRAFIKVLQGMLGDQPGHIKSRHLTVSHADQGSYWYVPSAPELGLDAPHAALTVPMNAFFEVRSANGRMFYNSKDYLHQLGNRTAKAAALEPLPTDRVVELLGYTFSRWHNTWYHRRTTLEFGHLKDYLSSDERFILSRSIAERKGYAVRKALALLSSEPTGRTWGMLRVHPKELIVGVVPEYTLGTGFETIRYLDVDEQDRAFALRLNESGAPGHNVPNYRRLLAQGVGGLLAELRAHLATVTDQEPKEFYQSAIYAFEGVQIYLRQYGEYARRLLEQMRFGAAEDRNNLADITNRMERLAVEPPKSFLDAAQLIFSMHCCLHLTGESVSLGRLDLLLAPFYEKGELSEAAAQEVIDCFWIKLDEQVILNHRHFHDRLSRGSGAITYEGGDFPQGAALNQWVQQVTVGGCLPDGAELAQDACNSVTRMCLRSARRLPLNAPCLSIRVSDQTPPAVIAEATEAILSGGAHPFLINDSKIVEGLRTSARKSGAALALNDARDMVCDGCFEPLIAGQSEFAFSFVTVPDVIELTLNRGRTYAAAGPVHLMGLKASYRSEAPEEIKTFEQFYGIFLKHFRYKLVDFYAAMFAKYGNLRHACPSPLLSPLIAGCIERGRDLSAGGARYKLLAPLMSGITTAIDSLWAINHMVFGEDAVFTLAELAQCLICDWGYDMKEPFCSSTMGDDRIAVMAERFKKLRLYALQGAKFGRGNAEVDRFARRLVRDLSESTYQVFHSPTGPVAERLAALKQRFGDSDHPFEFIITPGIATFEDYAGVGSFLGASADGRRACQPVPSDFSAASTPLDLPVSATGYDVFAALSSWAPGPVDDSSNPIDPIGIGLSNGAPVDINIRENFPPETLRQLLLGFAAGRYGSNMLSISCADPRTLTEAQGLPDCYDLVRLHMGGWSEFFIAMFPHLQEQHKRRPIYEPASDTRTTV
ncbi:MAG TPA: hypothetical protein DCQ33_15005 [Nitrospira sp.]|nr:hypothetical protein [Nitrospira sp.]